MPVLEDHASSRLPRMRACSAALLLAATASSASPVLTDNPRTSALDRAVDAAAVGLMADSCHVGVSLAVRHSGDTHFYDYGSTRRDRVALPTPDSVYEIASVTKTFTGALAARALIDGEMTLDGDFRLYLPEAYPNLALDGRPITLRSLATHTSGLQRDLPSTDALRAHLDPERIGHQLIQLDRGYTRARSVEDLRRVRLRSVPGKEFAYSNLGMRVIGYGLETVYGVSFSQLLVREILQPLGMQDTGLTPTAAMRNRLVVPYSAHGRPQPYHDATAGAAYGLYSTARDMGRFLTWQLDESDPLVARAHQPIRTTAADSEGLIWNIGQDGDARLLWHGGGSFGMTAQVVLYPDQHEGFVLLANDACPETEAALKQLAISIHHSALETLRR